MAIDDDLDDEEYQETRFFLETIEEYHDNVTLDSVLEVRSAVLDSAFLRDITDYHFQIALPVNITKIDIGQILTVNFPTPYLHSLRQ
jgi:hypothetical protein